MKYLKYISGIGLTIVLGTALSAQELKLPREQPSFADTAIAMVRSLPVVRNKEDQMLRQSKGKKHAIYWVTSDGLGLFTVKVMEDNGVTQLTHFSFDVDSASFKILNPNGKP